MRGEAAEANRVPPVLPLRAMTTGEVLDAATALLRQRALPLFALAAPLAAGEQVLLSGLRKAADATPPFYGPAGEFAPWWLLVATGFSLEVVIVVLLGALAGAAAGPAVLGRAVRHRDLWRRSRPLATLLVALLVGLLAWPGAYLGLVGGLAVFGLFTMVTPVLALERVGNPFRALVRAARLAGRGGLRAAWILLVGYLTWYAVRFALGTGWLAVVEEVLSFSGSIDGAGWLNWVVPAAWTLANTVAYTALACLAAVLLVEIRIRTEGLDIAVNRARARGDDEAAVLVATP